jgi:N utilization substance protein A
VSNELMKALELLNKEKKIDKDQLLEALKHSLISAYKKYYNAGDNVGIEIDDNGSITVHAKKTVVEEVLDNQNEIALDDAKKINIKYQIGDVVDIEATPKNFGLIAIQNAKQMMIQHIREAERGTLYAEYHEKENDIIYATIQKTEKRGVLLEIGSTETLMPVHEQIQGEVCRPGAKLMVYVLEVKNTSKGLQILVSRTHPGLVRRLFEREVPEIADGTVEIKSVSREAGSRTKLAVHSNNPSVDAVGACVGQKGARVNAVLGNLGNEKVDIIKYSDDPVTYISESLSPAKVLSVTVNEEEKSAEVIVPEFQLSLAIGKEGQNARLAAKLTGWKIDIKSDKQSGLSLGL